MKRKLLLSISLLLMFLVIGCESDPYTDEEPDPDPLPVEYDDRSLVTDECSHLDNIDDWQPVWCEEFDVDGLPDSSKWSYDVGGSGWGNNESQYYTNADSDNVNVSDGILSINAIKENFNGSEYTSARLITKNQGDWEYARVQIRAKLPAGRGLWSALWMLPTDWEYGGWPDSGEIDIMEYVGYDLDTVHGTLHSGAYNHMLGTQVGYNKTVSNSETEFHLYEMVWEVASIKLYIDGILLGSFGYDALENIDIDNDDAWPFDQRFHLIMNIAVGGSWGGSQGIDDSVFPQSMDIDYVRVYQKDYSGMDNEAPSDVSSITLLKAGTNSLKIMWEDAIDDIMVSGYSIYVDGVAVGNTTLNAFLIEDLSPLTSYEVSVAANDFAGNESTKIIVTLSTNDGLSISDRIEAEDYDSMAGINTEPTSDTGGGLNVGWTDDGDYLEYNIKVVESGSYTVDFRVSSGSDGGQIKLYKGSSFLATIDIPATGGWQSWVTVTSAQFDLEPGSYTFKVQITDGGVNINYFEFDKIN